MKLKFSKSGQVIEVTESVSFAHGVKVIPAWSKVRNELNKLRGAGEVVKTEPEEHPYYPREFPTGIWTVGAPLPREVPYLSPFFIPTDAWQMVDTWETAKDSRGVTTYSRKTGKQYRDSGYGLHYSTSGTTLGCIRIGDRADLLWLVAEIERALKAKEKVTLEVVS
jgi:hypothetical protein